jgi:O-antigen/teichoic acid export membrane protein
MLFIPVLGINGAGIATFLAIFLYNSIKLYFVYRKFKIFPFTKFTLKIGGLLLLGVLLFYFWEFPFHPIINIALKSIVIMVLYIYIVYRFNFSEDITRLIKKHLKLK